MAGSTAAVIAFVGEYGGAITAVASAAGAAVSAYSAIEQGKQAKEAADANAQIAANNAAQQEDAAQQQAAKIRKVGIEQQASASAALAGAGVKLGEGSAVDINRTIGQNTDQDVLNTLLTGQRQANADTQQSELLKVAGSNAQSNSYIGAGATILGSASRIANGWKTGNYASRN